MNLYNIVAGAYAQSGGKHFKAVNPVTGAAMEGDFMVADPVLVEAAMKTAAEAFEVFKAIPKSDKSAFLRQIAVELELMQTDLIESAVSESGLAVGRITGELGRTTGQLRLFADLVEEGSWVDAVIDTALPERTPMPRSDIRRMLVPIGPVVVFGASNFPLAFSVAGGDTASAFAAGCPVVVKAHPAHPRTSAYTGRAIMQAAQATGMPAGVFSMLYDDGHEIGTLLVQHPKTKAVAFTGSFNGGTALHQLAQSREEPIPVFAEMGSVNPVFLLPEMLRTNPEALATKYAGSITLGAGQFCTNPGLMVALTSDGLEKFKSALKGAIQQSPSATMLTRGILENYRKGAAQALLEEGVRVLSKADDASDTGGEAIVAEVSAADFLKSHRLAEEVFGPYSLLIVAQNVEELEAVAASLHGQLTVTVVASPQEISAYKPLIHILQGKAGRLIFNGVPTGVEVCAAMHHGGPFPATNSQFTSVGSAAVYRFVRPLAWQDWPDSLLPPELQQSNPYQIYRKIDHILTNA